MKLFKILPFAISGMIITIVNYVFIVKSLINYESINMLLIVKMIVLLIIPIAFFYVLTVYSMKKIAEYVYYHSFKFLTTKISDYITSNFDDSEKNIDVKVNNWIKELKPPFNNIMRRIVSKISLENLIIDAKNKYPSDAQRVKEFRVRLIANYVIVQINDLIIEHFATKKFAFAMLITIITNIIIFYI